MEAVAPEESAIDFYVLYYLVVKEDGGLMPTLDLHLLILSTQQELLFLSEVRLALNAVVWLVSLALQEAYFYLLILPVHR